MAGRIQSAFLQTHPDGAVKLVWADSFARPAGDFTLTCTTPGCKCALKHVSGYQMLGTIPVRAHFARMPGAVHDRSRGCEFANTNIRHEQVERINRIMSFIDERRGQRYLYLNDSSIKGKINLPSGLKRKFNYYGHHPSARQGDLDRTLGIKSAQELARLNFRKSFDDRDFYKNVTVVFDGYGLKFSKYFFSDQVKLLDWALRLDRNGKMHPVATEIIPELSRTTSEVSKKHGPRYFVPCVAKAFDHKTWGEFKVQPVLVTSDPEVIQKLEDDRTFMVCADQVFASSKTLKAQIQNIRSGQVPNTVPFYLHVKDTAAIAAVKPAPEQG